MSEPREFERDLGDGRAIWLVPCLYTWRVCIGQIGDDGYTDLWEFQNTIAALAAFALWEPSETPEPPGWYRHPPSGRRRPDGDPAQEYVLL